MRDFTEQLKPFVRMNTHGRLYYSYDANEFLKTVEPVDGEVVVYKKMTITSPHWPAMQLEGHIGATDRLCLFSISMRVLGPWGIAYQQGKPVAPRLTGSRLFAYSEPTVSRWLWRCLAPANSKFIKSCWIPKEQYAGEVWRDGELIFGGEYLHENVVLCDSITVLNFMGNIVDL